MQEDLTKIKRIRNGDIDAFGELVDKYRNRLFGFLVKMTGSSMTRRKYFRRFSSVPTVTLTDTTTDGCFLPGFTA